MQRALVGVNILIVAVADLDVFIYQRTVFGPVARDDLFLRQVLGARKDLRILRIEIHDVADVVAVRMGDNDLIQLVDVHAVFQKE